MSNAYEGRRHDLFDFPEVDGLEEFGLVPPVPADFREPVTATPTAEATVAGAPAAAAPVAAAPVEPTAGVEEPTAAPSEPAVAPASAEQAASPLDMDPARANPPVPAGVTDLDEDLFRFDEIFSLDEDPYFNGTLNIDGQPTNPLFLDETPAETATPIAANDPLLDTSTGTGETAPFQPETRPVPPSTEPAVDLVEAIPAEATTTQAPAAPAPKAGPEAALPETITPVAPPVPAPAGATAPLMGAPGAATARPSTTRDNGPRLLLPEDVPYSATSERQRTVWALIACFLLVNTGIFYIALQASSNFQSTMSQATGLLAEAITHQDSAPTHAAAPVIVPYVEHTIDTRESGAEYDSANERNDQPRLPEKWIDPSGYANMHEFAVNNAKALMTEGRFEDARRRLNYILANKARVPLAPRLRMEIDYLIPLTYFEQGNATAPEGGR